MVALARTKPESDLVYILHPQLKRKDAHDASREFDSNWWHRTFAFNNHPVLLWLAVPREVEGGILE